MAASMNYHELPARRLVALVLCQGLLLGAGTARAHDDALNLDGFMKAFGWDFATAEIRSEKLGDQFHVLFGLGGNIAVSIGADGVLLVDDQFPQLMPRIRDTLEDLGGETVDFVVNTHWHFDHAEGNLALGQDGAWIVSHEASREMMLDDHIVDLVSLRYDQKAYPKEALPVITFAEQMSFHFNGDRIDLLHAGPAHTTGDAAVFFQNEDAVHLGDVFNSSGYPFIDVGNGGDLDGVIAFCEAVRSRIKPSTRVIPGHGEISDGNGLASYIAMLKTVRGRVARLMAQGKTLEEVAAAKPTADFDSVYGDPSLFLNRAYFSLEKSIGPEKSAGAQN
jgi:glyoxylase-like metal-dependent hydrolase (beta-lactamase superfamily II)